MATFIEDIEELRDLEKAISLFESKNISYKTKEFKNGIQVLTIDNPSASRLSSGCNYGKRGGTHFYYLPNNMVVYIHNGYGFSGVGMPHTRTTYSKVFGANEEASRELKNELNTNINDEFIDNTVAKMESILKSKKWEKSA